jgi:hypothetical protein
MSYKLKTLDIIKINTYLSTLSIQEINNNWEKDKKRTKYFDFPSESPIDYIESYCSELRLYFIQDIRNIVFRFIQQKFGIEVFGINLKNIDVKKGIFFINSDAFSIIDYYQVMNESTGDLSNKYIKITLLIEKEPIRWCSAVIFELVKIVNNQEIYYKFKLEKNKI